MTIKKEMTQTLFIRVFHWFFAAALLVTMYTGLYIHYPINILGFVDMRRAELGMFIAVFIALGLLVARVYYGIVTGDKDYILLNRQDLKDLPGFLKFYLFMAEREPPHTKYNPGQKLIFTSWLMAFVFQTITGFILYDTGTFGWLIPLFGGLQFLRYLHYLVFIYFVATTMLHIYLAVTEDPAKLQAMVTGHMRKKETP